MEKENFDFLKDQQKKKEEPTLLAEINTINFPITTLDKRRRHPISIVWKSPDGSKELKWEIITNKIPGPAALKIQRCLESKIRELVRNGQLTLENRRFEYSFYELLENYLGEKSSGRAETELKAHIYDLLCLTVMTTSTLWDFSGGKYYEFFEPVRIYDRGAFVGDIIDNKKIEKSFIEVSEWYLKNIIYGFTKPLLPFYRELSPTAARLYEILSLWASKEDNILDKKTEIDPDDPDEGPVTVRHIRLSYSWLCERMPISQQKDRYHAMKKLENAHEELKRVKYLWEVELDNDWQLNYWLGREAEREIDKRRTYISSRKQQHWKAATGKQKVAVVQDKKLQVRYRNPAAQEVKLAGDFNSWQGELMRKESECGWRKDIKLPAGKYHYKFIVDGVWVCDPENPNRATDNQGNENSVLVVQ